jgi:hypothetical protein
MELGVKEVPLFEVQEKILRYFAGIFEAELQVK